MMTTRVTTPAASRLFGFPLHRASFDVRRFLVACFLDLI